MDKSTIITNLQNTIQKEIELISAEVDTAKKLRDQAPSAMESHSDTTRSEQEKIVFALQDKVHRLKADLALLTKISLSSVNPFKIYPALLKGIKVNLVIVPDGLGGRRINNYLFVSQSAPLAKKYEQN